WILDDNPGDYYSTWTGNTQAYPPQSGWGSNMRNSDFDYGQQIVIKATDSGGTFHGGWFYPWIDPGGELLQLCQYDPGGDAGASAYRSNICNCNQTRVFIGQSYDLKSGNMVGPTGQGVQALVNEDA